MAEENNCTGLKTLDPVQGLVDYINDVKPYHTKIIEVLIEYVYGENVDVTILEDPQFIIDLYRPGGCANLRSAEKLLSRQLARIENLGPEYPYFEQEQEIATMLSDRVDELRADRTVCGADIACADGYSTRPYGGPGLWPIISPNVAVPFETYPAINSSANTFTIPGDRSGELVPGTRLDITTFVEDYSATYQIFDQVAGPAGTCSYTVEDPLNDFATNHSVGDNIEAYGTGLDDGRTFTITSISPNTPVAGQTFVEVAQAIISPSPIGRLGLVRTVGNNTGTFTVVQAIFSNGSIDSWAGYPDVSTYTLGDDPHTIVTVTEPLNPPAFTPPNQTYAAFIRIEPVEIESVLSYSNFLRDYDPIAPDFSQTPDEGIARRGIVSVVVSTLDGFGIAIPDTGKITLPGNFEVSNIFEGDKLRVYESTGNNGLYTITSILYDTLSDTTTFGVAERVRNATPDGEGELRIPANVFIIDGDYRSQFVQGFQFDVTGGSYAGSYTTLNSDFINDKTRVRTTKEIIDPGTGYSVLDVTTGFVVRGDRTSQFTAGTPFNVVGSPTNDGSYTVDTVTYAPLPDNETTIVPVETFDFVTGGELHVSQVGFIRDRIYGFGESADFCDFNPEGVVRIKFHEQLTFDGLGLDLRDDVIAYNLENSDTWGYELPLHTIYSSFDPVIPEQPAAPLTPSFNDLWFDNNNGILYRWDSSESTGNHWRAIQTAYWLDTDTMILSYRTKTKYVDTGWVVLMAEPPGFSDVQPAVGETTIIGRETFTVEDVGSGTPQSVFEFRTVTFPIADVQQETGTLEGFFTIDGDVVAATQGMDLDVGIRTLEVTGGSPNDGTYTITSIHYNPVDDNTKITVAESIPSATTVGDITIGPLQVPGVDKTLIKVFINGVPANFTLDSATQFTLIPVPDWKVDDDIEVEVYDRLLQETNANVRGFTIEAHKVFHRDVTPYAGQNAYVLPGGNYINRFITENQIQILDTISPGFLLNTQQAVSFPLVDVDDENATITIEGDWTWLFTAGRIFSVRTSENNFNDFEVTSSVTSSQLGFPLTTVITIAQPDVVESPAANPTDPNQWFWNPGIRVLNVDEVSDTIIIQGTDASGADGDATSSFPDGMRIQITGSTTGNNGFWTVDTATYDSFNNRTNVALVENIPDPDSTGNARIHTPIYQNYSRDMGVILGAVYDPIVSGAGDQVKTYFVPNGTVEATVDAISYTWAGPLRMELAIARQNDAGFSVLDRMGVSDQLVTVPDRYEILSTDEATNTIRIHYDDPITGLPVNLSDSFTPGTIINIAGSYGEGNPSSQETNDAMYVVQSVCWDEDIPGTDVGECSPLTNTGDTVITIDNDFDNIPPYTEFTVTNITNNGGVTKPEITLAGDQVSLFHRFNIEARWDILTTNSGSSLITVDGNVTGLLKPNDRIRIEDSDNGTNDGDYEVASTNFTGAVTEVVVKNPSLPGDIAGTNKGVLVREGRTVTFQVDQPIVSTTPLENVLTVTSAVYTGTETILTIDRDFIDEAYTGPLGMIETKYRADIFFDSGNATPTWVEGYILREALRIDQYPEGMTQATFTENLDFGWGTEYSWTIIGTDQANSTIYIDGDITSILDNDDRADITGSDGNDGDYEVASFTYNVGLNRTEIVVKNPDLPVDTSLHGTFRLEDIDVTGWFQYLIKEANSVTNTFTVWGNATGDVQSGQQFRVMGTSNDGLYTVIASPVYDALTSTTDIAVASIDNDEGGGWIESYRDQGIRIVFEDTIGVSVGENATGALLLTAGNVMDAWDYPYWDIGSFDEELGTVIHLYSNTF